MAQARRHRLLAAVIDGLPNQGEAFPRDARVHWLKLMEMALHKAFGRVPEISIDGYPPHTVDPVLLDPMRHLKGDSVVVPLKKPLSREAKEGHCFIIDRQGFARRAIDANGQFLSLPEEEYPRIMPQDVQGVIYDRRGEGDLATITWADGAQGVLGLQLEISAAA